MVIGRLTGICVIVVYIMNVIVHKAYEFRCIQWTYQNNYQFLLLLRTLLNATSLFQD